jgi:hypothetical protein
MPTMALGLLLGVLPGRDRRGRATVCGSARHAGSTDGLWHQNSNRCGPAATACPTGLPEGCVSISANALGHHTLGYDCRGVVPPLDAPIFAASSLNTSRREPYDSPAIYADVDSMTQHPAPDPPAPKNSDTSKASAPTSVSGDAVAEPPALERSRFSQWLASFGLGEFQNPLLTRARPPATPHRRASQ